MDTKDTKIFILIVSITTFFSVFFQDIFPFSINPLFTKITNEFSLIKVTDDKGNILSNEKLQTYLDYASLFERSGIRTKPSINKMGKLVELNTVLNHIKPKLKNKSVSSYFLVELKHVSLGKDLKPRVLKQKIKIPNKQRAKRNYYDLYREDKYRRRIKNEGLL